MNEKRFRVATDSLGEMKVPEEAYWGAQTQRAVENFPISGDLFPRSFIRALGMIKLTAAQVNMTLERLDKKRGEAIVQASGEVMQGKLDDQFVVDIFQTGSGTSTNMNANEVIATRANELLEGEKREKSPVHPNDHVNLGQSSNDVIPSAIHLSAMESLANDLLPALKKLSTALTEKAKAFSPIIKTGRTHLQDATPIRLGQEFSGYARMIELGRERIEATSKHLLELAIGGTAVGTGINTHPRFAPLVAEKIAQLTNLQFQEAVNHFEAQGAKDTLVETSGALKALAVSLMKIANDIRWLGCGPRCGIGEIRIPAVQPGSSIMPGKVNPVIAESVCQVAAQVIGNDATIAIGGMLGNFELNVMMPVMAHNLLEAIRLLSNSCNVFTDKCISGIEANRERCESMIEKSLSLGTALAPHIGYDQASAIAKKAYVTGKTVREVAQEMGVLSEKKLQEVLDPEAMTEPA